MAFFINAVSDVKELSKIEESWDAFASNHSDNPYLFCGFIEKSLNSNLRDWTPLLMIGYANDEVVGIAPLMTRENFGMRVATFAVPPYDSPDFVIDQQFRREFIDCVLDYLFKTLKCKVADLTFPAESNNLHVFQELCRIKRIHFGPEPYIGRRVLEVGCNWEQFENMKGGNFRRRFRKMQNKLNRAGSCRVSCVEREEEESETFSKMLEIDKLSWKQAWRSNRREKIDPELMIDWEGARCVSRMIPEFKRTVWFLELNDHPIAYAMVLQNKQMATIAKTSYDARYRGLYPGMYLINAVLRTLFNTRCVGNVDFMTDMSFMETWTDLCRGRVRVLAGKGILPAIIVPLYQNKQMRRMLNLATIKTSIPIANLFG